MTTRTRERLIATYLAREGIELVRSLRDDNFLAFEDSSRPQPVGYCRTGPCYVEWRGPSGGGPQEQRRAICNNDITNLFWIIDPLSCPGSCGGQDGPALINPAGTSANGELYLASDGTYTHHGGSNTPTPFRRTVEITTLTDPLDDPNAPDDCEEPYDISLPNPPRPKAFQAKVTVAWGTSGQSVDLTEVMYPWMRYR